MISVSLEHLSLTFPFVFLYHFYFSFNFFFCVSTQTLSSLRFKSHKKDKRELFNIYMFFFFLITVMQLNQEYIEAFA